MPRFCTSDDVMVCMLKRRRNLARLIGSRYLQLAYVVSSTRVRCLLHACVAISLLPLVIALLYSERERETSIHK